MPFPPGLVEIPSAHSVDETVERLIALLQAKGIKLFALVDHSGEAKSAGLTMPPTRLLLFGNPNAGTPLMVAAPTVAIDLPLKVLVREDGAGNVLVAWNDPAYLAARHGVPEELLANIAAAGALAAQAAA